MVPSATRSARLRALLDEKCVTMPGAINALSAKLIEREGFEALYISGAVMANSVIGRPDVGMTTLTEAESHCANIARVTTIPAIADADTGYGEADNAARTVELMEQAGIAGIHMEDQVFPKRCGHLEGKQLVPVEEFCIKTRSGGAREDFAGVCVDRADGRAGRGGFRGGGAARESVSGSRRGCDLSRKDSAAKRNSNSSRGKWMRICWRT
jgi:methylisocitrate lyase